MTSNRPISRRRLWLFRLLAVIGAPLVFLLFVELVLRLAGYGYPTSFLLRASQNGQEMFVPNNQFGWRFFGRELARWPYPFAIPKTKGTNTIRIFVFGESAARGEPQPEFGLPRVLEALLSGRHPSTRFEVINAAMTAINSHTILPIARDCGQADGDIWVIYMGNNEVVGPFGAGTTFGQQTPSLPIIRASLAVKSTRTGQLLDSLLQRSAPGETTWGGLSQFLKHQVRADDPRMTNVYHHFARNLDDILQAGQRSGARIVLSTVPVNLKDCAPFASAHRSGLSAAELTQWEQLYQDGIKAQAAGDFSAAAERFRVAAGLDDSFAELRFRQGQCAFELNAGTEARGHFRAARDLDTLRFRCDTRLNELILAAATNTTGIGFVDTEQIFAYHSPAGLPGGQWFYEHVHLTYIGNYVLARNLAEQIEPMLPAWVSTQKNTSRDWPNVDECARRLARSDWNEAGALNSILTTLADPPFTMQLGHETQMEHLSAALARLSPASQPAGIADASKLTTEALLISPEDVALHKQLAILKLAAGDLPSAATAIRRALELLPNDAEGWSVLATICARQQHRSEAETAFRRAFQLGPQGIKSQLTLAAALAGLGQTDAALAEYQRVLAHKPGCVPALLQIGQLVESLGRKTGAESYFRQALTNRSQRMPELIELGEFFQNRGDFAAAAEIFRDACKLDSENARLQLFAGRNLASLGRYDEAAGFSAAAVRLSPTFVEARLLHGIVLLRRSQPTEARAQFEEALRLRPDSLDARLNLGATLAQLQLNPEALAMFDEVLAHSPTNALALKYARALRQKHSARGASVTNSPP